MATTFRIKPRLQKNIFYNLFQMSRPEGADTQWIITKPALNRYFHLLTYIMYERSYSAYIHLEIHSSDTSCNQKDFFKVKSDKNYRLVENLNKRLLYFSIIWNCVRILISPTKKKLSFSISLLRISRKGSKQASTQFVQENNSTVHFPET